jgi:hypothetical protein
MGRDPALRMSNVDVRWWINDKRTGKRIGSPTDEEQSRMADVAYVARHRDSASVILHIAGIHAIGSLGAAHYLRSHAGELFEQAGDRSNYDGLTIADSQLLVGPYLW